MRSPQAFAFPLILAGFCGCATSPTPGGPVGPAYAVGDSTRVFLEEIVVSLPLQDTTQPYQNLHIGLAATVNPVDSRAYSAYAVAGIVQRLEARIAGRVAEALVGLKEQSVDALPSLRALAIREAQAVADGAMRQWEHGAEYEVKILLVSIYWTDPSVGRPAPVRRGG